MDYTLKVLLFTDVDKKGPDTGEGTNELDEDTRTKYKKYLSKKYPNHGRFWAGTLDVSQGSAPFFNPVKDILQVGHAKNKDWKPL